MLNEEILKAALKEVELEIQEDIKKFSEWEESKLIYVPVKVGIGEDSRITYVTSYSINSAYNKLLRGE